MIYFSISFNRSEKRFEDFAICTFASDSKRKMCETAYQVFTRRNNFLNGLCGLLEREKRYLSGKVEIQFFQAEPRGFSYSCTLIFCKLIRISINIDFFGVWQFFILSDFFATFFEFSCFNSCLNFFGRKALLSSSVKTI